MMKNPCFTSFQTYYASEDTVMLPGFELQMRAQQANVLATRPMVRFSPHFQSSESSNQITHRPISESLISKSFHEPSVKLVKMDVIGTLLARNDQRVISHNWNLLPVFFQ